MKCDTLYDYGDEYPSDTIRQHEHINSESFYYNSYHNQEFCDKN